MRFSPLTVLESPMRFLNCNIMTMMVVIVLAAAYCSRVVVAAVVEGQNCSSQCGEIHNITYPFRLKGDPTDCGDSLYELTCQSDQTVLLINSQKYLVKNISYEDQTIRVVDSSIEKENYYCPSPQPSLNPIDLKLADPFIWYMYYPSYASVVFVNCSDPVENNPMYTPYATAPCPFIRNRGNYMYSLSPAWDDYHVYPFLGPFASDLKSNCNVISAFPVTSDLTNSNENFSIYGLNYSDIQSILLMGFDLSWRQPLFCRECLAQGGNCIDVATDALLVSSDRDKSQYECRVVPVVEGTNCSSHCGDIHNISYPFRLKGDPTDCGDSLYELTCQSNQTLILFINSQKYVVKNISYEYQTVRVVHSSIENEDSYCPSPPHSLDPIDLMLADPFIWTYRDFDYDLSPASVVFVNCSAPVENNSMYTLYTAPCPFSNRSNTSSWHIYFLSPGWDEYHDYPFLGPYASDLKNNCNVIAAFPVTSDLLFSDYNFFIYGLNYSDIRSILRMGFDLAWSKPFRCRDCLAQGGKCVGSASLDYYPYSFICDGITNFCSKNRFRSPHCFFQAIHQAIHDVRWGLRHYFYVTDRGKKLALHIFEARELIGILCVSAFLFQKFRRRKLWMDTTVEEFLSSYKTHTPTRYSYSQIKKMTDNYKEKLGQGGFGSVFKGKLISGGLVAIKVLGKSKANGKDFINEVATIGRIHHVNVVQLIGFCSEGLKRALIYEFMPKGSLDKYIYSKEGVNDSLSWEKIYEIALGIARGIEYLHRGCDMQILHFDIKPHNILLDENFQPKIADFGLAKFYSTNDNTVSVTAVRGTMGYIAPELIYRNLGGVSYKSDVYSFGMMLMEMSGKRKNLNAHAEKSSQIYFPSWVYNKLEQGEDLELRYDNEDEKKIVKKLIIVALWCIQLKPVDRPSMKKVMEMLEGSQELLEVPPKPFLATEQQSVPNEAGPTIISMNSMDFSLTARS